MNDAAAFSSHRKSLFGLRVLALVLIPLLLVLHAPVLAAVVPSALLTVASLEEASARERALPAIEVVASDDIVEQRRIAAATLVEAASLRV